jgi:hypothetical protein
MKRIQRLRKKGWRMPTNTVYVGRPSKWGNPFRIGADGTREEVILKYRKWLEEKLKEDPTFLNPLKGKDLACWCPLTVPCHADVILEILSKNPSSFDS